MKRIKKEKPHRDVNDKLMRAAGFCRDTFVTNHPLGTTLTCWNNLLGLRLVTRRKHRITLKQLVAMVANAAAHRTRSRMRAQIAEIDRNETGFVN